MNQKAEKEAKVFKPMAGTAQAAKVIGNQAVLQQMRVVQMAQDHHVIPRELKELCNRKYSGGYDYLFGNLTVSLEYHIGSHPNYTAAVKTALGYIDDDARAVQFAQNLAGYLKGFQGLDMNKFEFSDIQHLIPPAADRTDLRWMNYGRSH